jgi:hypothetical protein
VGAPLFFRFLFFVFQWVARFRLLGFRLRLHLLDLLALILDFLLLLLHLGLGLRIGVLRILHRIADYVASSAAEDTTERGARQRMADGRSDQGTTHCTNTSSAKRAFFTSRERLP